MCWSQLQCKFSFFSAKLFNKRTRRGNFLVLDAVEDFFSLLILVRVFFCYRIFHSFFISILYINPFIAIPSFINFFQWKIWNCNFCHSKNSKCIKKLKIYVGIIFYFRGPFLNSSTINLAFHFPTLRRYYPYGYMDILHNASSIRVRLYALNKFFFFF